MMYFKKKSVLKHPTVNTTVRGGDEKPTSQPTPEGIQTPEALQTTSHFGSTESSAKREKYTKTEKYEKAALFPDSKTLDKRFGSFERTVLCAITGLLFVIIALQVIGLVQKRQQSKKSTKNTSTEKATLPRSQPYCLSQPKKSSKL